MTRNDAWITQGFEAFRQGTFGNGGQNLYVSKAGVLQRIFRYDFRNEGHFDLLFVNSQDMDERPPVYVYDDLLNGVSRTDLPTRGAYAAAVGDLNGNGLDDLVIGHQCDGSFADLTAFVYYGALGGFSERYKLELPAPNCRAVAIGDFDGDGLPEILFACNGRLRVFSQADGGFIPSRFTELEIDCLHMVAADLDGDGFADLYVRPREGPALVLWGGPYGLDTNHATVIPGVDKDVAVGVSTTPDWVPFMLSWRPKILCLEGVPHLFRGGGPDTLLIPVGSDRSLGEPLVFPSVRAAAAAGGDINGNGHDDVVLVCYAPPDWTPRPGYTVYPDRSATSWIYWGGPEGFDPTHRTPLETLAARDVAVVDLDNNGFADVVVCQGSNAKMHDVDSLIFKGCASGNPA